MSSLFTDRESPPFDLIYYTKLIKEREEIINQCKINNQKRRAKSNSRKKKEPTFEEMVVKLSGEELVTYLQNQGFKLNPNSN